MFYNELSFDSKSLIFYRIFIFQMALLPYLLNDLLAERERDPVSRLFDQDFGVSLLNDDLYRPSIGALTTPLLAGYLRPLRHVIPDDSGVSTITRDKDNFKVSILRSSSWGCSKVE